MPTAATQREISVPADHVELIGDLTLPASPIGVVIFAHGSGSSRHSPRNRMVAGELVQHGCATLLLDLLTDHEAADRRNVFDIELLARRLQAASAHLREVDETANLPQAYFGASTGAAAALVAAALTPQIAAVVSRGGRPDLAGEHLARVTCPTLLLVGALDSQMLDLNRQAQQLLAGPSRLDIIDGATHLFEEPGTLEQVARSAAERVTEAFAQANEAVSSE